MKRLVNFIESVPADPQSTELFDPNDRPFDRPACRSQRRALRFSSPGNACRNARPSQDPPSGMAVVTFVRCHTDRAVQRTSSLSTNSRKLQEYQRQQLFKIMHIGSGDDVRQGNPMTCGHQVQRGAQAASICRVRAGFCPPKGALIKLASTSTSARSSRPVALSLVRRCR